MARHLVWFFIVWLVPATSLLTLVRHSLAKDYILTVAGGFSPQGNQASLEANVLFFQELVENQYHETANHKIYFADGFDSRSDLQVLAAKPQPKSPAYELLIRAFDLDRPKIEYRNHEVKQISGAIVPQEIRSGFDAVKEQIVHGDRLVVYVTAHGNAAKGKDKMNTTIACWNRKELSMREFSGWLDELPDQVPVVLIMAQCYCGGFVNAMFEDGDSQNELAKATRVGFFAQRHDLAAAGCRPDIENDEEYSSYFWGAVSGKLRSGKPVVSADFNQDGRVSFAEAHAFAVMESPTIDIPLRTSDEFLRRYSQINEYLSPPLGQDTDDQVPAVIEGLAYVAGSIEEVAGTASPEARRCVLELAKKLGVSADTQVSRLFAMKREQEEVLRQSRPRFGRGGGRGPRSSRRRDFREELIAKWPELKDPSGWDSIPWLQSEACEPFLKEVRELTNYEPFQQSLSERTKIREQSTSSELRLVQFRRLLYVIESIVLEKNLSKLAKPEILAKYQSIKELEQSGLGAMAR